MGLRLEVYNDNFVGLIVDFSFLEDYPNFYSGDSVDEAIAYFKLYKDAATGRLKQIDPFEASLDVVGIETDEAAEFRAAVDKLIVSMDDETALANSILFPNWEATKSYIVGDRIRYADILYKCLTAHDAQESWTPDVSPSLWAKMLIDPEEPGIPEWEQPGATNGYSIGDIVTHNGIKYISLVENNIWEPGAENTETLWEVYEEGTAV